MRVLYIGQYSPGTTSRMRAETLAAYATDFTVIDIHVPFYQINRFWRSIGFRLKRGPLVSKINAYLLESLPFGNFDLVWVDKGIFINSRSLKLLKEKTSRLVHYTPDAAFYQNQSYLFEQGLAMYDILITTKTFELEEYYKRVAAEKVLLTTQGYDPAIHKPYHSFEEKEKAIVFVGLCEPLREQAIQELINAEIPVKLAGVGWNHFVAKNQHSPYLTFVDSKVVGLAYGKLLSSVSFGLGMLSKKFPEQHTTRTFEIPACGTLLLTERNPELSTFYSEDEVCYYSDIQDLVIKVEELLARPVELQKRTIAGLQKVRKGGYEYASLLKHLLDQILISS